MKYINWKVRIKNKYFWLSIIPAALLLIQQVLAMFGVTFDIAGIEESLVALIGAVFSVLAILGVVTDPTTEGMGDSEQALTYDAPKTRSQDDAEEVA